MLFGFGGDDREMKDIFIEIAHRLGAATADPLVETQNYRQKYIAEALGGVMAPTYRPRLLHTMKTVTGAGEVLTDTPNCKVKPGRMWFLYDIFVSGAVADRKYVGFHCEVEQEKETDSAEWDTLYAIMLNGSGNGTVDTKAFAYVSSEGAAQLRVRHVDVHGNELWALDPVDVTEESATEKNLGVDQFEDPSGRLVIEGKCSVGTLYATKYRYDSELFILFHPDNSSAFCRLWVPLRLNEDQMVDVKNLDATSGLHSCSLMIGDIG